ncbi:type III secretion system effector protein [Marivita sp. S6314]|uniref:M91 family zinc metallopeptidase n=1 Tax=Marivita sp. S6314 TaxID=2926406 RepID=UPI001FF42823|nr:M91 family zinc metallopeptidase [Marivita sp. S6314]MCK0148533.1 type III secretion system effector protein [Marivita sp. S6314]
MPTIDARSKYDAAIAYLRRSDMARSILDELQTVPEQIVIKIGPDIEPKYRHPKVDDGADGGIVEWNPDMSLDVFDSPRERPSASWVRNKRERYGLFWRKSRQIREYGTLSPAIALIHELGHAYQFFGDRAGYRSAMTKAGSPQEDNVVGGIETVVITELRQLGHDEGIRWYYGHTA